MFSWFLLVFEGIVWFVKDIHSLENVGQFYYANAVRPLSCYCPPPLQLLFRHCDLALGEMRKFSDLA